jgi:putative flippase GtrA
LDAVYITIDSMNYFLNEKILKFGVVGVSGMAIDFSVTWLLKEKLKANKYIANSAGFSCAVVSNFILNNIWTFNTPDSGTAKRFCLFIIIAVGGLLISNISLYFLLKYVKINFYLLKLVVTGIVFFWNYFLNLTFTFN